MFPFRSQIDISHLQSFAESLEINPLHSRSNLFSDLESILPRLGKAADLEEQVSVERMGSCFARGQSVVGGKLVRKTAALEELTFLNRNVGGANRNVGGARSHV